MVIAGNVQGVGYRALVKQIARRMGVRGRVKNLDDGTVEVHCEAEESVFQNFKKAIDIKARRPEDPFALHVDEIWVTFEGEAGYLAPGKELGPFEIDYGEEAESAFERANLERLEIGSLILLSMGEKVDTVGEKVDGVGQKVDIVGKKVDRVGQKVDSVGEKVDGVGEKVDSVGEKVESVGKDVRTVGEKVDGVGRNVAAVGEKIDAGFSRTDSNFKDLDGKYDVVSKELKSMNENLTRLVSYVGALVEDITGRKAEG
jgi:acylphosphatase/archaellum component FlaC